MGQQAKRWATSTSQRDWFRPTRLNRGPWDAGDAEQDKDAWPSSRANSVDDSDDEQISILEQAATNGDEIAFLTALEKSDLSNCSPRQFVQTIKLAFRAGAFIAACDIAAEGHRRYPEDAELNRYVQVLTSNRRIGTQQMALMPSRNNMEWLNEHAGEYSGQWLALRDGQLLGSSRSLEELVQEVRVKYSVTFPSKEIMLTTGY